MEIEVRKDEEKNRFVLTVDGTTAGFAGFVDREGTRKFDHTVIEEQFQGQGLSKPLIQQALDYTKDEGLPYIATCSAVQHFIEKNPEYKS
ncbi:GNAT family N-acetyltransferase [Corynebacterium kozikiae]|uniref:GNAT family N-acetyltransferase n=1 Tax=Corynebacterium kozikiae TaxID=2968469 RepID=UPI00211C99FE|nr:GNAT family N-acetyltransferase [Corynebacterium sp. 76QC2CO]MCQ9344227.1 N-acetyltransferase [Corynebacterium sp. 76QC2CO]